MLKLLAVLLVGGLFLTSSGCCWPIHDGYRRGGWDDRAYYGGGYDGRDSRPRDYPRAPAPYRR
jgi:hypothetical protein